MKWLRQRFGLCPHHWKEWHAVPSFDGSIIYARHCLFCPAVQYRKLHDERIAWIVFGACMGGGAFALLWYLFSWE